MWKKLLDTLCTLDVDASSNRDGTWLYWQMYHDEVSAYVQPKYKDLLLTS